MATDFRALADILSSIADPPRLRRQPREGDLQGRFDEWFDGGATKIITGWKEYHFANGTVAVVPVSATLQADIRLPNGHFVKVSEGTTAPKFWPFSAA
jgi:hypothetical protein